MRRNDHPSRPSAGTCCCLLSPKTLLMAAKEHAFLAGVNVSAATRGGRFSGVHQWPVLDVHRGTRPASSKKKGGGHRVPPPPKCLHEWGRYLRISEDVSGDSERRQTPPYQRI